MPNFAPNGPLKLNHKHILAAALIATGATQKEVCLTLDISAMHMSILYRSPLFQAEVKRLQDKLQNQLVDNAVDMLHGETVSNVNFLKEMRDNAQVAASLRLKAVDSMLDRVPRTSKTHKVETTQKEVSFTESQVNYLIEALEDDKIARDAFKEASQRSYLDLSTVEEAERAAEQPTEIPKEAMEYIQNSLTEDLP
jgi:hypothetical protein